MRSSITIDHTWNIKERESTIETRIITVHEDYSTHTKTLHKTIKYQDEKTFIQVKNKKTNQAFENR